MRCPSSLELRSNGGMYEREWQEEEIVERKTALAPSSLYHENALNAM